MEIMSFSKAMYSTWTYYAPDRILFDCGEGISTIMANKIYAVQRIFLTHSHADHISGLWGFLNTRNSAMGEREKPLEIYYPAGAAMIRKFLSFIIDNGRWIRYPLNVQEIEESFALSLAEGQNPRTIRVFRTQHMNGEPSFGYRIVESRKRLKEDFRDLPKEQIRALALKWKTQDKASGFTEVYHHNRFTLSGDGLVLPHEVMTNTETLMHECTFLSREDRKGENHTALDELIAAVEEAKPKRLILYHVSSRYNHQLKRKLKEVHERLLPQGIELMCVIPGKVFKC